MTHHRPKTNRTRGDYTFWTAQRLRAIKAPWVRALNPRTAVPSMLCHAEYVPAYFYQRSVKR